MPQFGEPSLNDIGGRVDGRNLTAETLWRNQSDVSYRQEPRCDASASLQRAGGCPALAEVDGAVAVPGSIESNIPVNDGVEFDTERNKWR
jgi:hypothetical protein